MNTHWQQGYLLNKHGNSREPWKKWAVFQKYSHNVSRIKLQAASQSLDFDSPYNQMQSALSTYRSSTIHRTLKPGHVILHSG